MARVKYLNTEIDNLSMEEALQAMDQLVQNRRPSYVVTPNVNHIVRLQSDRHFYEAYQNADLILADGMPIIWTSGAFGDRIREKVSGSDILPKICEIAANKGYSVFLLGAAEGVAAKAADNLTKKYAGLKIAGVYSPPQRFEQDPEEVEKAVSAVRDAGPDILIVGLGSPKQEYFIYDHLAALNVPLSLGLGAGIDFEAGKIKRAPAWMSKHGLEWLYRCIQEPIRLTPRYLKDSFRFLRIIWNCEHNQTDTSRKAH